MTTNNSNPEITRAEQASELYDTITTIDPLKSPARLAIEQVIGVETAELFLLGYAERISTEPKSTNSESIGDLWDPLTKAYARISIAAADKTTIGDAYKQIGEIMEPWNKAIKIARKSYN